MKYLKVMETKGVQVSDLAQKYQRKIDRVKKLNKAFAMQSKAGGKTQNITDELADLDDEIIEGIAEFLDTKQQDTPPPPPPPQETEAEKQARLLLEQQQQQPTPTKKRKAVGLFGLIFNR